MITSYIQDGEMFLEQGLVGASPPSVNILIPPREGRDNDNSPIVVDFGENALGGGDSIAYVRARWLVSQINLINAADDGYQFQFQLSNDASFGSGVVPRAAVFAGLARSGLSADVAVGDVFTVVDNEYKGVLYRYGRFYAALSAGVGAIAIINSLLTEQQN